MEKSDRIDPKPTRPLGGEEPLGGVDASVGEFWRWAFSDLRTNIVRGVLAEFLVARAVGAEQEMRLAWDNFDVLAPDGTRIEVKSSAYLQSWSQRRLSTISFSGLTGLTWDDEKGWGEKREVRADVFVFAVQTCRDPERYDPLDIGQWQFWVVSASAVHEHGTRSVGMTSLREAAGEAVGFERLAGAIERISRRRARGLG